MEDDKQVQVKFTTKLPAQLRVPSTAFAIPAHLTRYGLSEVVNTLLNQEKPVPFDFLVDGELLRTSLLEFLTSRQLSAESLLSLEYIPAVGPPSDHRTLPHEDWVSCVDGRADGFIVSGSYDCAVRLIQPAAASSVSVFVAHADAVTSLSLSSSSGSFDLLTSSKDRSIKRWKLPSDVSLLANPSLTPVQVLQGHTAAVQSVDWSPGGERACSGGWDNTIKIWDVRVAEEGGEEGQEEGKEQQKAGKGREKKKRKTAVGKEEGGAGADENGHGEAATARMQPQRVQEVSPSSTLSGHSACVSAISWPSSSSSSSPLLVSSSWDHSVRCWDAETGANTVTKASTHPYLALSVCPSSTNLVACGAADPKLRVWDMRDKSSTLPSLARLSHKGWVSGVKWHRTNPHLLLSSSYDGMVKVWDTRGKIPLHTISAHKDKALCCDWWGAESVVSGGADSKLHVASLQLAQ